MKKFWANLCVFAMVLIMSVGFSVTALAYSEDEVIYIAEQYLTSWMSTDFGEYLEESTDFTDEAVIEQFTNWQNLKDNMGEIKQTEEWQITEAEGILSVVQTIVGTNDTILFTVDFDKEAIDTMGANYAIMEIKVASASASNTEKASFSKAALNTVMAMSIVFFSLIFIAIIIYLFKFIPVILDKVTGKKEDLENKQEPIVQALEMSAVEETSTEEEIVAAITAAIMAYEAETGAQPGTFVVRSIRRRQR